MVKEVTAITMPKAMIDKLDFFLETNVAKEMGFESRPQVFISLLREFLEKMDDQLELASAVFFYIGRNENYFTIKDKFTQEEIKITKDTTGRHRCTKCYPDQRYCPHIRYFIDLQDSLPEVVIRGGTLPEKYVDLLEYEYKPKKKSSKTT